MANRALSHSTVKVYISTTVQNSDLTESQFEALAYTQVGNVGSIGEYGISTNVISYDTLDRDVSLKAKGITDGGSPDLEVARDDADLGQIAMRAAGAVANKDNYAFKIEKQDGAVDYLRGLVAGPRSPSGRNEDFDLHVFTLGIQQEVVHSHATP